MSKYAVRVGSGWVLFPSSLDITWKPLNAAEFESKDEATSVALRVHGGEVVDHPMAKRYGVVVVQPKHGGRWQYVASIYPLKISFEIYQSWASQDREYVESVADAARRIWPDAEVHVRAIV